MLFDREQASQMTNLDDQRIGQQSLYKVGSKTCKLILEFLLHLHV